MNFSLSVALCLVASIIIGYLLGSLNFAIIATKIFTHEDIREHGSGNAGLTNVLRTQGKGAFIVTLLGDFCKGILSVIVARLILTLFAGGDYLIVGGYVAVYGALLGHVFPLYYGFKGGKGILVSFGALMILSPIAGIICFVGFLAMTAITKYVSVGSIIAGVLFPFSIMLVNLIQQHQITYEVFLTLPVSIIIIYMHRENIKRLINHTENKISFKKKVK